MLASYTGANLQQIQTGETMSVRDSQERYRDLRESFDELQIQDKALFLVEAAVSTLARGIEQAGETLADEMGDLFRSEEGGRRSRPSSAASPSTSERQAPHRRQKPGSGEDDAYTGPSED